ncbi:hypothetical protein MNBD_GAMMA13-1726 [hydrothermal vent metagenome]|uniref:Uncharacterized protein n=1 Tax=hydrothermal vent metagenome TaxID=652676 RepID=A0A3B0YPI1_9ZZZZ
MEKRIQRIKRDTNGHYAKIIGGNERKICLEAARKAAEKFGSNSAAYRTITQGINAKGGTGSQYFWVNHLATCLPQNEKIISLEEMEMINDHDKTFFEGLYVYVPEIILRTETPVNRKEQFILSNLVAQINGEKYEFSSENPLRISGLELVKDENPENAYGLLLNIGNGTKISTDKRFSTKNSGGKIPFGKRSKKIWTRSDSLSAVCLGGGTYLYADGGFDLYADCIRRVVVFCTEDDKNSRRY